MEQNSEYEISFSSETEEEKLDELEKKLLKEQNQKRGDLLTVLSTKQGRRFVWGLLVAAGVFQSTYNPKAQDIKADMAFSEGRKQVGYELLFSIQSFAPNRYALMQKENGNGR